MNGEFSKEAENHHRSVFMLKIGSMLGHVISTSELTIESAVARCPGILTVEQIKVLSTGELVKDVTLDQIFKFLFNFGFLCDMAPYPINLDRDEDEGDEIDQTDSIHFFKSSMVQ